MSHYDRLYDEVEQSQVRYIGFTSETTRFDFAIVYTGMFLGKTSVIDMQMGRSVLMSIDDVDNMDFLQKWFNIDGQEEAQELVDFFKSIFPAVRLENQY